MIDEAGMSIQDKSILMDLRMRVFENIFRSIPLSNPVDMDAYLKDAEKAFQWIQNGKPAA